jgi:putative lipoic acid-binding regulatory protein
MTSSAPPSPNGLDATAHDPRKDSLIEYPCLFPVKVMGANTDEFVPQMTALALQHDPFLDATTIAQAASTSA